MYVGKAKQLDERLWSEHCTRKRSMSDPALRRNVAQMIFEIAPADDIKQGRYRPSAAEVQRVSDWVHGCEVAWIERDSEEAAIVLEKAMKREYMPPLTKR